MDKRGNKINKRHAKYIKCMYQWLEKVTFETDFEKTEKYVILHVINFLAHAVQKKLRRK
jgi:hypothetical protein